jgi:hypothetical protein
MRLFPVEVGATMRALPVSITPAFTALSTRGKWEVAADFM